MKAIAQVPSSESYKKCALHSKGINPSPNSVKNQEK